MNSVSLYTNITVRNYLNDFCQCIQQRGNAIILFLPAAENQIQENVELNSKESNKIYFQLKKKVSAHDFM